LKNNNNNNNKIKKLNFSITKKRGLKKRKGGVLKKNKNKINN